MRASSGLDVERQQGSFGDAEATAHRHPGPNKRTRSGALSADGDAVLDSQSCGTCVLPGATGGIEDWEMTPGLSSALGLGEADGSAEPESTSLPDAGASPPRNTIALGSTGPDVQRAQSRLNAHSATPPLVEDGTFGSRTYGATLAFQNARNLAVDGIIGSMTWAALDAPASQSRGQSKGTPSPQKNVHYDTGRHLISVLPPNTTLATVKASIDALKQATPPEITDAHVVGVKPNSHEEIFVWNVIVQLGRRNRWGSEADLETVIGFQPPTGKAPVGMVTLRIDPAGKASAELLKGAMSAGTSFASVPDAEIKLRADFGIAEVKKGTSADWTPGDLGKVHAALSTMSPDERTALTGLSLVREHTLALQDGTPVDALFFYDPAVPPPARVESLKFADGAFADDDIRFVGDAQNAVPASFETIVHEAGHAVETKALRDAHFARASAEAQKDQDLAGFLQAQQTANISVDDYNNKIKSTVYHAQSAYANNDKKTLLPYLLAIKTAATAIVELHHMENSQHSARLEGTAVAAVAARASEKIRLANVNANHPALRDFNATVAAQDKWLATSRARAKALTRLDASKVAVSTTTAAETAAQGTGSESKRLANFVDFVTKNKIEPCSYYARINWPAHPEEFYADAFSLFHTDPHFMQTNYKSLFDWFANGEHLK